MFRPGFESVPREDGREEGVPAKAEQDDDSVKFGDLSPDVKKTIQNINRGNIPEKHFFPDEREDDSTLEEVVDESVVEQARASEKQYGSGEVRTDSVAIRDILEKLGLRGRSLHDLKEGLAEEDLGERARGNGRAPDRTPVELSTKRSVENDSDERVSVKHAREGLSDFGIVIEED